VKRLAVVLLLFVAVGWAQPPQELTIAIGDDTGRLNPHDYSSQFVALTMVYEPLVRYAIDGTLQPALAESWEVSEDGLTWTFKLRQGVTFHDGTPFNAEAAKWNFDRWVGQADWDFLPTTNNIAEVTVQDEYTLVLTLKTYLYTTLNDLAVARPVRFLSPQAVDADGAYAQPIGTGPWKVEEYQAERQMSFVPNESYWGGTPKLSKVTFLVIPDPQTRIAGLISNQIDVIGGEYLGAVPLESIPALKASPTVEIVTSEGSTNYFLQMNVQKAPFDDPLVRRAINHAVDREAISQSVFGGYAKPAEGVFPVTVPYFKPTEQGLYSYDPELSKELLAEAGWTDGGDGTLVKDGVPFSFTLVVDQGVFPQARTLAQVVQDQLKNIGIELNIETLDYNAWIARLEQGDYDLATNLTWGAPYDPHSSLAALFKSVYNSPNSERIFSSPELDTKIDTVLAAQDETAREAAYGDLWTYLDDVSAGVPLVSAARLYAVRKGVTGFEIAPTEYELSLLNVEIESR
jgi:nickel transport system substrate-binding protein